VHLCEQFLCLCISYTVGWSGNVCSDPPVVVIIRLTGTAILQGGNATILRVPHLDPGHLELNIVNSAAGGNTVRSKVQ